PCPKASRACWRASAACCAWRRSRARRSCAVRRRPCRALTCLLTDRMRRGMMDSCVPCGSVVRVVCPRTRAPGFLTSVSTASPVLHGLSGLRLSLGNDVRYICAEPLCLLLYRLLHTPSAERGRAMTFEEILDQALAMLQRRGRLTYGTLKRQFQLDD